MCCSLLQCVAVCSSVLQCVAFVAVCCSVLQRDAVCCSVLQCVAVCCDGWMTGCAHFEKLAFMSQTQKILILTLMLSEISHDWEINGIRHDSVIHECLNYNLLCLRHERHSVIHDSLEIPFCQRWPSSLERGKETCTFPMNLHEVGRSARPMSR